MIGVMSVQGLVDGPPLCRNKRGTINFVVDVKITLEFIQCTTHMVILGSHGRRLRSDKNEEDTENLLLLMFSLCIRRDGCILIQDSLYYDQLSPITFC